MPNKKIFQEFLNLFYTSVETKNIKSSSESPVIKKEENITQFQKLFELGKGVNTVSTPKRIKRAVLKKILYF